MSKKIRNTFLLIACISLLLLTMSACGNSANNGNAGNNAGNTAGDNAGDNAGNSVGDNTNTAGVEYSATAQGYGGDVIVTVSVANGAITSVTATGDNETPEIGGNAIAAYNEDGFTPIIGSDVETASSDQIDAVSGATLTSTAIKTALDEALAKIEK